MINAVLGKKIDQTQKYLENGKRIAVTRIYTGQNYVTRALDGRVQLGFGEVNKTNKAVAGILKKANLDKKVRFFKEVTADEAEVGRIVKATDVLQVGDVVQVMGTSKGKGFQGGVKRYGFKGGPRTHGQSDRERAPGSIGQTTTPGRVYKGKRMAGNMGNDRVTVTNLPVMDVTDDSILVAGLVPGGRNSLLVVTKTGEVKKFVGLYQEPTEAVEAPIAEETPAEEVTPEEPKAEESKEETVAEEHKAEEMPEANEAATEVKEEENA